MNQRLRTFWLSLLLPLAAHAQGGTGLTASYYDTDTFGTLKTTRVDATIDFNWGTSLPAGTALTSADTFSVVWSGQLQPAFNELYTFYLAADDYARVWVDDQLLVGRTFYQSGPAMRGQIRLKANQRVNIRVEYVERSGSAFAKLEWESNSQPREVVPAARLFPTAEIPNGGALMREVWKVAAGTGIASLTSTSGYPHKPASRDFITSFECIARSWDDGFGTRVTGYLRAPVSGAYTFAVSGDDVVQLHLSTDTDPANSALIASVGSPTGFRQWDAAPGQQSATINLVGGQAYYVELLHKEETGADHWSVAWRTPGESGFSVIPGTALMMPGVDAVAPATASFFDTLATEHPRLGFSRERVLWLKQMYQSPDASAAKTRAAAVVSSATGDLTAALTTGRSAQDRIQRLALAWWLTDDTRYGEAAWNTLQHCITNADWTPGDWKPWKGVENGVIAIGYDWLHPYWSTARRAVLIDCMVNKGFAGGWTDRYSNNLGVIMNSGQIMAALAVGTENESVAEANLATALQRLRPKIDKWAANAGAWYEGTGYGIFTKWNLGQAMPAMETALGSTFDLSRIVGLHTAAKEPLTIASNTRQRFTFSDVGTGSHASVGWANWWGRRYNAPEVYDYSRQIGNSPLNALFLPETTISPAAAGMNTDTAYRGPFDSPANSGAGFMEVVTMRENWTDTKATFVGGMGGTYFAHGMLQSGSFQLYARGLSWFIDLSSETYHQPGWITTTPNPNGPDRWDYYRNRAEGHNCVVINPTANPDRIWNAPYAPLINYQSAPNGQRSFAIWDLSKNITGVTRVQRGLQLLNNRKQVLIQDEIVTPSASKVWWFAHYSKASNTVTIGPDATTVTLQQGSERLWGKIIGGGGTWTIRPATPLPTSPNPAENTDNSAYSKLAIELTGVTNTTLAVWFVPLAPGEDPPATTPAVAALSTWNLVTSNEAPVARNANVNSAGDDAVDVALPAYLTDDWTPAARMTYAVNGAVGGSVGLLPDGVTARFTPTPGSTGLRSFTFLATDLDGAPSNQATIVFSVAPQVATWVQPGSGGWSTPSNWQGAVAPASSQGGDVRFFSGQSLAGGTYTATNDLPGPFQLNRLTLAGTGASTSIVNLDGNPLTFVDNGLAQPEIALSGSTSGFRYQVALPLVLDETVTLDATGSGTFFFSGPISGPGGVTRTGTAGTLIFSGDNSYAGPTHIAAGTLQIGNDSSTGTLGNGQVTIASGATLRFDRTGSVVVSNDITGGGRILINGTSSSDVASLTGDNDFTGEVRVDNGSLRVSDAKQLGTGTKKIVVASTAALLRLDGSAAPVIFPPEFSLVTSNPNGAILNEAGDNEIAGNLTISSGAGGTRLTVATGSLTIGGTVTSDFTGRALDLRGAGLGIINGDFIDGTGANTISGFSKNDAGTWILNGNNSISSTTVVSGGKLVINGSHASGNVTVASGAVLAGRGSLTAATTITGTLAPGDAIGTLNFGSTLSFGSASKLQWEIAANSLVADQAVAAGTLSVTNGAKIDLVLNRPGSSANFLLSFWRSPRTWPVAGGASLTGFFQLGTVSADSAGHPAATYGLFSLQHTATGVNLVWTPLPGFPLIDEPVVAFLSPTANPALLPNPESTLRIAAAATGTGPLTFAWTSFPADEGAEGTVTFGDPAAAETAVTFSAPGRYALRCTATNSALGLARSADLIVDVGPPSDGELPPNALPSLDPGPPPEAAALFLCRLAGVVTNQTSLHWEQISGPAAPAFSQATDPTTGVIFAQAGSYVLRLKASNSAGEVWRDLAVEVASLPPGYGEWQELHWPGVSDPTVVAPAADPDQDGANNAAEFLAATDPTSSSSVPSFIWSKPTNGNWSEAEHWTPTALPGSHPLTKVELFTGLSVSGTVEANNNLGTPFILQRLTLSGAGPGTARLTGGALQFSSGGVLDIANGGPAYEIAAPLDFAGATTVQGNHTVPLLLSGALSGTGALTKSSNGTLELSGPHELKGTLTINGGALRISGPGTGTGNVTLTKGTMTIAAGGSIAPPAGGTLTLGSNTSANGPVTLHYDSALTSRFGSVIVGNGNDGSGNTILNQSAGTILATALTLNNGYTSHGAGELNLSGGTLAISGTTVVSNQAASDNVWSTLTVGANATFSTGALNLTGAPATGRWAAGRVLQNGGAVTVTGNLTLARTTATNASPRRGEYHLNAGTLALNAITQDLASDTFGTFIFNGGTLLPRASSTTFWPANPQTSALIKDGGAKIDTAGFDITLAQPLVDFAGATTATLAKQGNGTLTLSGANTYTGATAVEAGTLAVTGSLANSAVQVLNGATLTGTGSLGGSVTVRSGGRQAFAIAAATGEQTARPIAGTLVLEAGNVIDLSASTPPAPGAYVLATATGGIIGAPDVVNLNGIPGSVSVVGNELQLTVTAPATGYAAWLSLYPELTDVTVGGDPDGDGVSNLQEYVLNGNPTVPDAAGRLPALTVDAENYVFSFSRRSEAATDTSQTFEYSLDLSTWTPLSVTAPTAAQVSLGEVTEGFQTVTITLPKTSVPGDRFFGRLRITKNP